MNGIVALHGFTATGAMFAEFSALVGGPVVAPDLPGHGAASDVPADLATAFDVVAAALPEAGGPLLGYSMGGRIALRFALARPRSLSALVLVSTSPGITDDEARAARRTADEALAVRIEADGVGLFLDQWLAQPMFAGLARRGPEWQAADRAVRASNTPAGLAAALRGLGQGAMADATPLLSDLAVPVLVVVGAEDDPYRHHGAAMAAALAEAEVAVVPGSGHSVVGEAPGHLARLVHAFV